MIDFTVTGGEETVAQLRASRTSIMREVMLEVERLDAVVLSRVQEKLSGGMLQQRSGRLLGSAHKTEVIDDGSRIIGGVEAGGGVAFYGIYFEKGGKGPYKITPKTKLALAFFPSIQYSLPGFGGPTSFADIRGLYTGFRTRPELKRNPKALAAFHDWGGIVVKSVNHPAIPHLPFMKDSLEETRSEIIEGIRAAVERGAATA
jgi:hypothetical protein